MLKELKFFFFILLIITFFFLSIKFYFSDQNKKISNRAINSLDTKLNKVLKNLPILKNDTKNIILYPESNLNKNKKKRNFLELFIDNEK
jgi:hypothetical protein